ncbi:hypothetical protein O6H91_Y140100 [Diphasiastrum complanatum]|nr:hypothetical protein O6H91_Y140100 [Diphasiastrum complanatum]KAJ7296163.1 hypothetical protein O6H91_Y140100 [Diphasiastrum complanatum]
MKGLFGNHLFGAYPAPTSIILVVQFLVILPAKCSATAMFVFGDSLVDSGNNNFIGSIAKANFLPNGVDYPTHAPTGRFCNGKIIPDFLSDYMGASPILPILDPNAKGENLLRGANFASAGVGILDDTGAIFARRLIMPQQFQLFQQYQRDVTLLIGEAGTKSLISKALFSFTVGGNDYINNYLLPFSTRAKKFTPPRYRQLLISTFREQLKKAYTLGARKVTVSNMGPIGCIPSQLAMSSQNGTCIPAVEQYATDFNSDLRVMLQELNRKLPGATFSYVNGYDMIMDYIKNPALYGFESSNKACCGQGAFNGLFVCTAVSSLCPNRSSYIFWDPFHPTDTVNTLIAKRIFTGPPSDISPVNVSKLLS